MSNNKIDLTQEQFPNGYVILESLIPSTRSQNSRQYDVLLIGAGRVLQADGKPSKWLIPPQALKEATHLFDGIASYIDHPDMFGFGWHQRPSLKDLVGSIRNPAWDEEEQGIIGELTLYDHVEGSPAAMLAGLYDQILADRQARIATPNIGLSAVLWHESHLDEETGLRVTDAITQVESVDHVYSAGARGYVRAALSRIGWEITHSQQASPAQQGGITPSSFISGADAPRRCGPLPATPKEVSPMAPKNEKGQDDQAQLAPQAPPAVVTETAPPAALSVTTNEVLVVLNDVLERLEGIEDHQAQLSEQGTVQGMGHPPRAMTHGMANSLDRVELAVEALFSGTRPPAGVRPLSGIRELYTLLSGDYEMTGVFQDAQVYLANVTASTMAQLVANVLNKRVMITFQEYPQWWLPIVTIEDFGNLQQVRWITLGGVGELPTVAEGAAYSELTWDDLAQRDSFIKKGGYLGLTLEAIDKDDTRRIQMAPRALAQAAWLTLSKSISAIFTVTSGTGPSIYYDDSNTRVLFHSSNSNLGSTALSVAAWKTTRIAMRDQTEHNSGEPLGALTAPKFCLVPAELEFTAIEILASENKAGTANNDANVEARGNTHDARLAAARERVIVVDLWTNAANWAAIADPRLYPSIGLGFRFGRTPEIFSVADPRAGLMFSNDVMPVKVRFLYATGPVDWRGMYKHNI